MARFPKFILSSNTASMPPMRTHQSLHTPNEEARHLAMVAEHNGGKLLNRYMRHQPYNAYTPHPNAKHQGENVNLPPLLRDKIRHAQSAAVNKLTQRKDESRLREFLAFCEGLGIRPTDALPAREEVLLAWASTYAGCLAGKTVSAKLLAIRKEHERRGLIWSGGAALRRILKGVEELRPTSSFRSKRAPVTIPMLEDLNRGLNRSSGLDNCVRAIALLSFFCQLRSGEILPPTQNLRNFNPLRHATFAHIAESTADNGACNLHLPWSKTQKGRGDDVWIPRQEAPLDPIHAIHKHFIKNRLNINHPIASYRDDNDNIVALTRSRFLRRINNILKATKKYSLSCIVVGLCYRHWT